MQPVVRGSVFVRHFRDVIMEISLLKAVIVNYRTPDLVTRAVESFRRFYEETPLLLIDNGSGDTSAGRLQALHDRWPRCTEILLNQKNLHHGPAMDQALRGTDTEFVFFLDSDCVVDHGDFLERMLNDLQESPRHYAIGKRVFMDARGFDIPKQPGAIPYIRPICMMVRRPIYLTLPPFERHGTPCLNNMKIAASRGLALLDFPVEEFISHEGRGTAGRYGYQLGVKGKLNYLLHKLGL